MWGLRNERVTGLCRSSVFALAQVPVWGSHEAGPSPYQGSPRHCQRLARSSTGGTPTLTQGPPRSSTGARRCAARTNTAERSLSAPKAPLPRATAGYQSAPQGLGSLRGVSIWGDRLSRLLDQPRLIPTHQPPDTESRRSRRALTGIVHRCKGIGQGRRRAGGPTEHAGRGRGSQQASGS